MKLEPSTEAPLVTKKLVQALESTVNNDINKMSDNNLMFFMIVKFSFTQR